MISINKRKAKLVPTLKYAYTRCSHHIMQYYQKGIIATQSFNDYNDHLEFMAYLAKSKHIDINPLIDVFIGDPSLLADYFTASEQTYLEIAYPTY